MKSHTFSNFYTSDGLQNNEFRRGAHFRSKTGEMFFGGIVGLTAFYPFALHAEHELMHLMFTNLYFYNDLMARIRQALDEGTFAAFRARYSGRLEERA